MAFPLELTVPAAAGLLTLRQQDLLPVYATAYHIPTGFGGSTSKQVRAYSPKT